MLNNIFWIVNIGDNLFNPDEMLSITNFINEHNPNHKHRKRYQFENIDLTIFGTVKEIQVFKNERNGISFFSGIIENFSFKKTLNHFYDILNSKYNSTKSSGIRGQYSLCNIENNHFSCLTDQFSVHKVYYGSNSDGTLFISNHIGLISCVKERKINYQFFANWIATADPFGTETEDFEIRSAPAHSLLSASKNSDVQIKPLSTLEEFISSSDESQFDEKCSELSTILVKYAQNLSSKYTTLLPLSGGFDSRLIFNILRQCKEKKVLSYTYDDTYTDLKIAKTLCKRAGLDHIAIYFDKTIPSFLEVTDFLLKSRNPFRRYSQVFDLKIEKQLLPALDSFTNAIVMRGNGGATDVPLHFYYLHSDSQSDPLDLISAQFKFKDYLTEDGFKQISRYRSDYYFSKYKFLKSSDDNYLLHAAISQVMFERFLTFQCYNNVHNHKFALAYFPFANPEYIKLLYHSPKEKHQRSKRGSIHHKINHYLNSKDFPAIHFNYSRNWEATKPEVLLYYLRSYLTGTKRKQYSYSRELRSSFFIKYKRELIDILSRNSTSQFNRYIDIKKAVTAIEKDEMPQKIQMDILFRLAPLLLHEEANTL